MGSHYGSIDLPMDDNVEANHDVMLNEDEEMVDDLDEVEPINWAAEVHFSNDGFFSDVDNPLAPPYHIYSHLTTFYKLYSPDTHGCCSASFDIRSRFGRILQGFDRTLDHP
jgi:hypothetical protein